MTASTLDRVSNKDRRWFAAHPRATERLRRVVPGECWPEDTSAYTHMLVVQLRSGARARIGLRIFREDDGPVRHLQYAPTGERWTVTPSGAVQRSATGHEAWERIAPRNIQQLIAIGRGMERAA